MVCFFLFAMLSVFSYTLSLLLLFVRRSYFEVFTSLARARVYVYK